MVHRQTDDRAADQRQGTARGPDTAGRATGTEPEPQPLPASAERDLFADRAPLGLVRLFAPAVPIVLDGEPVEDEERMHADFPGPLHLTRLGHGDDAVLGAFTDRAAMLAEARRQYAGEELPPERLERAKRSMEHVCTTNPGSLPEEVYFYEDAGESGDVKRLPKGRGYPNLSRVSRGFLGTQNWNDVISSLSWCRYDVSLFDAFDWQGNEFFAPKGCNTPDLNRFGWGDRAASIANWGG
ncbi:hypothetical protein [Streptomyces sp. TRM49041]|uniref:hypothetical protein n=1 Tax=Streptomyces sp. TRM49041 TaxID=2603216 RepID=UPI0011EF4D55|nr:hypothetical protein [Streptomyces sp. TRM49041]